MTTQFDPYITHIESFGERYEVLPVSASAEAYATELCSAFGHNFRRARREAEISQGLIADTHGVSRKTIVQVERGRGYPSLLVLAKLALAVGLDVPSMLKESEPGGTG